jgi:hypothetical protein
MSEHTAYRIVEIKYRLPHTLFHGLQHAWGRRSRLLPINTWIKAEQKLVVDGGKQEPYLSGFNVLLHEWECDHYLTRFTAPRNLRVVKIKVRGKLRKKESNKGGVMLAEEMFLEWPQ